MSHRLSSFVLNNIKFLAKYRTLSYDIHVSQLMHASSDGSGAVERGLREGGAGSGGLAPLVKIQGDFRGLSPLFTSEFIFGWTNSVLATLSYTIDVS